MRYVEHSRASGAPASAPRHSSWESSGDEFACALPHSTGIDNVSWTTRPSCQDPYRPQVPFEAPTVTVFIGDSEVVSECDDEVEKTQQNRLCSLTKLKPSFQPKQSHVHHSQVSACSRAQPPNEPGSSRDQVGDHLREKTSTQLGASAPAQTVHYASSREAARNAVPGHTNVVLQVQKSVRAVCKEAEQL
ncbi:hypothetical protein HPB51_028966 [Rhipicephalus microplus]|uniref:Uncharacterized protein n=1 Tax=Rhipicephalus microplus TaxID=6941 RepID=A0A9J6CW90_RHIMP|nr:hypothetical protein HPB51_028966 [Rhipicephalus microplus]